MKSIRRQLLVWLTTGFCISIGIAAVAVYRQARLEARVIFDYQLQQMATLFPAEGFGPIKKSVNVVPDMENVVVVQIWNKSGTNVYQSRPVSPPPEAAGTGFSTISQPDGDWRIYSTIVGDNYIQVSQPTSVREALAARMAFHTIMPLLVIVSILIFLIWIAIGYGLKPLNVLAAVVRRRSAADLEPLPSKHLPSEVAPLVEALNGLLARLGRVLSLQRAFIADAAHELRTPLTAIKLQLQNAQRAHSKIERDLAFGHLRSGIDRTVRLVEQMLTLARSERDNESETVQAVDLASVTREAVAEQSPIALAKDIKLGLTAPPSACVGGDVEGIRALITNLLDNAIRYTPSGGAADVEINDLVNRIVLHVRDSGPGIPEDERTRVFHRFYRGAHDNVTGSGLGLAIVRRIAQRHGATVMLGTGIDGSGLGVTVEFPKAA